MINVIEVKSKKQQKQFLEFPNILYKDNKQFVPPLYMDEKSIFSKKNMYKKTCKDICFIAYKDNQVVGRIQCIIQTVYNEIHKTKICRFSRFDSIDDLEVSTSLFDKAKQWALSEGMNQIVGPLGYSDFEREGLLIDGFDERQTFEEQYNYPYYQKLIENYGFVKDVDWVESELKVDKEKAEKIIKLGAAVCKRNNYTLLKLEKHESKSHYINRLKGHFFYLLDEGYKDIYGTVPFSDEMKKQVINEFKLLLDPKYIKILVDEENKPIAFALAFPHISPSLIGTGGHLSIKTILKLLKISKNPSSVDLGLVAVNPDKLKSGAVVPIIADLMENFIKYNLEFMETNLNLEDNKDIKQIWTYFIEREHKKRRSFKLNI